MDVPACCVCGNQNGAAAVLPHTQGWHEILPKAEIRVMHVVTHFVWEENVLGLEYTQTHRQWQIV